MKKLLLVMLFAVTTQAAVTETALQSRKIWVYTPPAYDAKQTYPLLILFDGESYQQDIPAAPTLDDLIAKKSIRPLVAVMIDTGAGATRLADLANHKAFADYVAKEVLPWVRSKWSVSKNASDVVLSGFSAGGLAAAYVAYRHPEAFGNVFSQSGAFWRGNEGASAPAEWLTEQFRTSAKLPIRFYLDVGDQETVQTVGGIAILDANRHLHDVLVAKKYDVTYVEVPHAHHNEEHWRATFPDGIRSVFAARR